MERERLLGRKMSLKKCENERSIIWKVCLKLNSFLYCPTPGINDKLQQDAFFFFSFFFYCRTFHKRCLQLLCVWSSTVRCIFVGRQIWNPSQFNYAFNQTLSEDTWCFYNWCFEAVLEVVNAFYSLYLLVNVSRHWKSVLCFYNNVFIAYYTANVLGKFQ